MNVYSEIDFRIFLKGKKNNAFEPWCSHKACVTPPYFADINGELNDFFNVAKGLRQGHPLSPYLFVIVMEALVGCLREKCGSDGF